MQRRLFITGTDTDAGKTLVACTLATVLRGAGHKVAVAKPLAAGAEFCGGQLRNDDALALQQAGGGWQPYVQINPLCFADAVAPHVAAERVGSRLSVAEVLQAMQPALSVNADALLVEGAGGWQVPLNATESLADLAVALRLPVLLVVGIKLGCLNHAILTAQAIQASGLPLAGWIGSVVQPDMPALVENIATLKQRLPAPCWGVLPHTLKPSPAVLAGDLRLPPDW